MEFFLHIMYFLCRRCERRGLQGVLFRRRGGKKSCMYGEEGGGWGVEGFSGAVQARSAKICLMHSLNLGPARASLKVTGEACAERSRRKKPCNSSPHATGFPLDWFWLFSLCEMLYFQFPMNAKTCHNSKLVN